MSIINLIGKRFGRYTVLSRATNKKGRHPRWNCVCDCGKYSVVDGANLKAGHTVSCGCFHSENVKRLMTPDKKEKMRISRIGRRGGEKSNFWKGGLTQRNYGIRTLIQHQYEYRLWRDTVFKRDDYTCQDCLCRGGVVNAHHIKPVAQIIAEHGLKSIESIVGCNELWNLWNGVTLCYNCHKKRHAKG